MNLSAFTVSRNLLTLGHPFIEAALSVVDFIDEYIILECGSFDETPYWWEKFRRKYPDKVRIEGGEWASSDTPGLAGQRTGRPSGLAQDDGLSRCRGDYALCVHADEVWHPESAAMIRDTLASKPGAVSIPYLHLQDNFQRIHEHYTWCFTRSEMLVKTNAGWCADNDGWRMWLGRGPTVTPDFPKPLVHAGYVFPVNAHRKNIHHLSLYPDMPYYQRLAAKSREAMKTNTCDPIFDLTTSPFDLPDLLKPLVGWREYRVRPELLD